MKAAARDIQLVCLPFRGSGASFFNEWQALSDRIQVLAVQLPGREKRYAEPPHESVPAAIAQVLAELRGRLDRHRPVAVFGHSLGAVLAYELAHKLALLDELFLIGVVASGSPDPWSPRHERAAGLPDAQFLQAVSRFSQYTHAALENPMMRELLLPTLRADVRMHESYCPQSDRPLDVPIVVLRGEHDELVSAAQLAGWRKATTSTLRIVELPGGHMYLTECPRLVLQAVEAAFL